MLERGQASYFGSGMMPEGPKPEAQRAESGVGSLGRGSPLPTSYGSGNAVIKLTQRGPGGKFRHGISIVEMCYKLSSRKVDTKSVIN